MRNWKQLVLNKASALLSEGSHTPLLLREAAFWVIEFVANCGRSNPISFAVRPLLMDRRLRKVVGIGLAVVVLIMAMISPISIVAAESGDVSQTLITDGDVNLATRQAVRLPVAKFVLTQKFWLMHPGVDLAADIGEPVSPIMSGKVIKAEWNWFGYGNMVVVEHGPDYESLYAHLSKIYVEVGQDVTSDTMLGEVGSTGHSTGPHLHLEIHEDGKAIDPALVLGIK
jgi:hypothetical protein